MSRVSLKSCNPSVKCKQPVDPCRPACGQSHANSYQADPCNSINATKGKSSAASLLAGEEKLEKASPELDEDKIEIVNLPPRAIFGINGEVPFGLHVHPDRKHFIFPLGTKIGIEHIENHKQEFISGHTNSVSSIDVSDTGRFLASGQISHMGFRAYVILWDYEGRKEIARHDLHKVKVQSVCFSAYEKYIISIGGQDDGTVIVYDIESSTPICRSEVSRAISGMPLYITGLHNNASFFMVCGDRHLRIWSILHEQKKLQVHDVNTGKCQRRFTGIRVDKRDEFAYLGTMTGDIVKVVLNCCDAMNVTKPGYVASMIGSYGIHNPCKPYGKDCSRYINGVRDISIIDEGLLLIGSGDGTVEVVEERKDKSESQFKTYPSPTWPVLRTLRKTKVQGSVSSMVARNVFEYYVATDNNEIYVLNIKTMNVTLMKTCHKKTVNSIVFPSCLSTVFATAGYESIRLWSTVRLQELLRIMVYNFYCAGLSFTNDGTCILSAWNDGVIRAFTPITGRLMFAIPNAHNKGCTSLVISSNGRLLVTGGIEGQVRVWKIESVRQSLVGVLKDHSGPISSLHYNHAETEVISASSDGSCVIWDIMRMCRKLVITANTQFMCGIYIPSDSQLLTSGSDGRISYWMVYNGSLIRELQGTKKSSVNCLYLNPVGDFFVSAGSDQMVKIWDYNRGHVVCQGNEHASAVISTTISPCGQYVVSGSTDGCIVLWDIPEQFWGAAEPLPEVQPDESKISVEKKKSNASVHSAGSKKEENVSNLVKNTPKGKVCCVECPPILATKKKDDVPCDYVPSVRKC